MFDIIFTESIIDPSGREMLLYLSFSLNQDKLNLKIFIFVTKKIFLSFI